jgi:hypothetical protein
MGTALLSFGMTTDVRSALSDLAVEELHYIIDGVRAEHAGAPADLVEMELRMFQRVRQLDPAVVQRIAVTISEHALAHA